MPLMFTWAGGGESQRTQKSGLKGRRVWERGHWFENSTSSRHQARGMMEKQAGRGCRSSERWTWFTRIKEGKPLCPERGPVGTGVAKEA